MSTTTVTKTQTDLDPLNPSLWTPPQELCLLQSLTRLKPVGIHKHFRMLAIQANLLSSGTIPHPITDHPHVSTTEGIWRKLGSLYDLKALDEREDAIFTDSVDDDDDEQEKVEYWREFELPADGFEAEMWGRRLASGGEEEGWSADDGGARDRESTVADSEDPRSSPVDAGSVRGTRSSNRRAAAGRRLAEVKQEESATGSGRGGSRRTSKAATPSVEDEDTEMQDADAQDENDEESEDEDTESDQEGNTDDRKSARLSRGRGGRRGRGRRGRRGK